MKFKYSCSMCGQKFPITPDLMVCPSCSASQKPDEPLKGVLEVELDGTADKDFDIFDLLPVEKEFFPPIPVGNTPMWAPTNLRNKTGFPNLHIKYDGSNPTGSFKDRASYLCAAFAKKHNINKIVLASTGNAGSSMAGVGASAGMDIIVYLPKTAPVAKLIQTLQYGAELRRVDGNYDKAFDLSIEYWNQNKSEVMSRNTGHNPMTIEGKKTVSLEMFKDLGEAPDYVFISVGDGVIIAGIYKGFKDLLKLGIIDKMPTICAVQSTKSNSISQSFKQGKFVPTVATTIADSISVDVPKNGYYALSHLEKYNGKAVEVTDEEIVQAQLDLSADAGCFTEPAGSTAYAGFQKIKAELPKDAKVVILATGNGLKDIKTAEAAVKMPEKLW